MVQRAWEGSVGISGEGNAALIEAAGEYRPGGVEAK
jgi:hypothetical protein